MKLYTLEKVLYFANQQKGLHVSVDERRGTDLMERVERSLGKGWIIQVAEDDSGRYFKTTTKGKVQLLRLQIQWRKQHGRSTDEHEQELAALAHQL
ncbi:MAG: hypothetical protein C9356_12020 [Oleiphilus sp.]|nr:MAG: hypothetical protein C9356_12020 [Oleiphilus sp.]